MTVTNATLGQGFRVRSGVAAPLRASFAAEGIKTISTTVPPLRIREVERNATSPQTRRCSTLEHASGAPPRTTWHPFDRSRCPPMPVLRDSGQPGAALNDHPKAPARLWAERLDEVARLGHRAHGSDGRPPPLCPRFQPRSGSTGLEPPTSPLDLWRSGLRWR